MLKFLRLIAAGSILLVLTTCGIESRKDTDAYFVSLDNLLSPDGKTRILVYQYDTGAYGYTRVWWAVVPAASRGVNLIPFELPDGYKAVGWSNEGDVLIEPWKPYYDIQKRGTLKTGDLLGGVKVQLVEATQE